MIYREDVMHDLQIEKEIISSGRDEDTDKNNFSRKFLNQHIIKIEKNNCKL